jgi:hypothetical protein
MNPLDGAPREAMHATVSGEGDTFRVDIDAARKVEGEHAPRDGGGNCHGERNGERALGVKDEDRGQREREPDVLR